MTKRLYLLIMLFSIFNSCATLSSNRHSNCFITFIGYKGQHPTGDCPVGRGCCATDIQTYTFATIKKGLADIKSFPERTLAQISIQNDNQIKISIIQTGSLALGKLQEKEDINKQDFFSIGTSDIILSKEVCRILNCKTIKLKKGDYKISYINEEDKKNYKNCYSIVDAEIEK